MIKAGFEIEYDYATQIVNGLLPYRDFSVEYPPVAMLFIALPRLFASGFESFVWAYSVEVTILNLAGIYCLMVLARDLKYNPWKILGIYTIALLALGPLVVCRLDFIPAMLTLFSIFFFLKYRNKTAWILLAVATLTKIYPAVIAPVFFIMQLKRKPKVDLLEGPAAFAYTALIIVLPFVLTSQTGLWDSFFYHGQRPLQIESTYASFAEFLWALKLVTLHFNVTFGSNNIDGAVSEAFGRVSFGIMIIGLLAVYWALYRNLKKEDQDSRGRSDETAMAVKYSLISVLVFILTCKVFSPQYMMWLLPLVPLFTQKWKNVIRPLFIAACILTFFIFPQYYQGIRNGSLFSISLLFSRNVVLIVILGFLVRGRAAANYSKKVLPN